jgi:branched-chain amino acid transport system substrate-binding protein
MGQNLSRRTLIKSATALAAGVCMPAVVKAQADSIRIGHLTPLTGFLGPLGEYAVMGIKLAAEEVNAGGGVLGRKIELVMEDSINPQTASAKAERLIERDKVAMIIGEISSASGLAIGQVANRLNTVFINTGCNSDAMRGASCNQYMFHIEAANSMYVQATGQYLLRENLVKGKKWYSLTADYAFGHDLLRVAKKFMESNGGQFAADELVPTDAADFSPYLLKIRQARPDLVISNLAGNQITNFLKQYTEYGLTFPVAGFGFDTVVAWGAGKGNFSGIWPLVWHHLVDTPTSKKYVEAFQKKYGKPPDNQSLGGLQLAQDRRAIDERDEVNRSAQARRASSQGCKIRCHESARSLFSCLRQSDDDGNVRGSRQGAVENEGSVGYLRRARDGARSQRGFGSDRSAQGRRLQDQMSESASRVPGSRSVKPRHLRAARLCDRAGPQWPSRRRLLPAHCTRPLADFFARRHCQSGARRLLRHRRVSGGGAGATYRLFWSIRRRPGCGWRPWDFD